MTDTVTMASVRKAGRTTGQHKHNPTALAAARGELPPKPPKKSKRQLEAELRMITLAALKKHVPGTAAIMEMIGENHYV